MGGSVRVSDLKRIVARLGSEELAPHVEQTDLESAARVIHCIAATLEETQVKIDPNKHMLRTTEAAALAGYLKIRYRARAKRKTAERKKDAARAAIDARDAMMQTGEKITEARIAAAAEIDEQYVDHIEAELAAQEVMGYFEELRQSLDERHEVMVEISRNERAILKDKDDQ